MDIQVVGHTSFLGKTGINSHAQNFFVNINNYLPVRIRNYTYTPEFSHFEKDNLHLLIEQDWQDPPFKIGTPFIPDPNKLQVNIVLNESHHYFYYHSYNHPMIAYNVWESTLQMKEFFNRLLDYDQLWTPTSIQAKWTIDQGYPESKIRVVPEGVDGTIFKPSNDKEERKQLFRKYDIPEHSFVFFIAGRWDYRKSTQEMIEAWRTNFGHHSTCYLVLSVDNPFSTDGFKSTEERLAHHKLEHQNIRVLHFPPRDEYVKWLQHSSCLIQCSRSEGWGLPLLEAIACGTPTIASNWGGHLEFADGISELVDVPKELPPKNVYMIGDDHDLGVWGEPDFDHLGHVMDGVFYNYDERKAFAVKMSRFVRQLYTWDNAARIAEQHIKELVKNNLHIIEVPESEKVKLNLGCGNDIRKGYINVDRYNNTGQVDFQWDIGEIQMEDNSVDEIFTAHVFEHIPLNDVYPVMEEWERVLRPGGKLEIHVPNLEHEVKVWLESPDDQKWSQLHRIFGGQTHEGNFHFNGNNPASLKHLIERFNFRVDSCELGNSGFGEEIQLFATKIIKSKVRDPYVNIHFVDGPFCEITGDPNDKAFYTVDFLDPENNASIHQSTIGINCWTRPHRKYFTDWLVSVKRNGDIIRSHRFNAKEQNVLISFDTKSLGDSIAWMPQVEEFRKKHECNVFLSTFWNNLFVKSYSKINFIEPGMKVNNIYASFMIGCWEGNSFKHPTDWRLIPLQRVCSDILGLEYKEIVCDLGITPGPRPIEDKYVTISQHSTFQCKYWNRENGWQEVVDYLNEIGYKVMVISKEETDLKNVLDYTNRSIEETITNIHYSDFFIGISSGPSWIGWALRKPVIMISGWSAPWAEFYTNCTRIINSDVCNSCFNRLNNNFDRGNWNFCPFQQGTESQYECTKSIEPQTVINSIDNIISKLKG